MIQNTSISSYQPYQPIPSQHRSQSFAAASHVQKAEHEGKDILRDGPLRYWGYLNEFAETGKDLLNVGIGPAKTQNTIKHSYTAVKAYVGVDSLHKAIKGYKQAEEEGYSHVGRVFSAAEKGVEAGVFQAGASLYGPAFVIATFRDVAKMALAKLFGNDQIASELAKEVAHEATHKNWIEKRPEQLKKILFQPIEKYLKPSLQNKVSTKTADKIIKGAPMLASAALIPMLVHPIDSAVHKVLDVTYRPLMKTIKHGVFGEPKPKTPAHQPLFASASPFHHAAINYQPLYQGAAHYPQYSA